MNDLIPAWENGVLKPIEKLEVHQRGLKHKAVSVFAICKNEILIQQRAQTKYHTPGLWANTCCTHPRWNENAKDCAIRRLNEELGLLNVDLTYKNKIEYQANVGNGLVEHEIVDIFVTQVSQKVFLKINKNPEEVMNTKWLKLNTLNSKIESQPEQYTPWLRIYLKEHFNQILVD